MAEILSAELRADAERLRELVHLALHVEVAKSVAVFRPARRQAVEVAAGRKFYGFHRQLSARPPDDDREMVGRARGGAEGQDLLLEEGEHAIVREDRGRRLKQERLVGRAATLGDEQELVGILVLACSPGINLDLRRQV